VDKREALIGSAAQLLIERGADAPTIADIAAHAGVPTGNVYYYFKTRDELVAAVIDSRAAEVRSLLATLDRQGDPRDRLVGLIRTWSTNRDYVVENGCPIGSLCSELNKRDRGLDDRAGAILATLVDWISKQFRLLGQPNPVDLAHRMLGGIQGASLLANTLRKPSILTRELRHIQSWIDELPTA
jgi:AcrR family transcriptional regulator